MTKPHKVIWLQWYGLNRDDPAFDPSVPNEEICWCQDNLFDTDIKYVMADKPEEL